ncbi:MAG: B12-binding domain-containing radical SAM protein [Gemmatimonadota bacterium]|nr:MAG: B12-binding domain-containing radical SAM protein [Gemmatimonadota bacterium]
MRVVLVSPQSEKPFTISYKVRKSKLSPPTGILYLASAIQDNFETAVIDSQFYDVSSEKIAERILSLYPDVVGLSVNYHFFLRNAKKIAQNVKKIEPNITIVFGGSFATFLADELIKETFIDIVVLKEGEVSFGLCLKRLERKTSLRDIPGIVFKENSRTHRNEFSSYINNLDSVSFPDYSFLENPEQYLAKIVSSRGCNFNCIYCTTPTMWKKWRARTPSNIIEEIKDKVRRFNIDSFHFADDNFCVDKKRMYEIMHRIEKENLGIRLGFSSRIELVDDDMLEQCAKANFKTIFFGVESGSERILNHLRRRYSVSDIEKTIDKAIECGILPFVSFMIGMPWETADDIEQTFRLMQRINTPAIGLHVFTPYPGTEVYNHPEKYGITVEVHHPEDTIGETVLHRTRHLRSEDLRKMWIEGLGIAAKREREAKAYLGRLAF